MPPGLSASGIFVTCIAKELLRVFSGNPPDLNAGTCAGPTGLRDNLGVGSLTSKVREAAGAGDNPASGETSDESFATEAVATLPRAILYDAAGHDRECEIEKIDLDQLGKDQLLWVDLTGTGPQGVLSLPESLRESVGPLDDVGHLELFDEFYRFGVPLLGPENGHLQFIVGTSWVITMSEQRPDFFDEWIDADRGETLKGRMTATAFAAALLMRHFDVFREQIAGVDVSVDRLDDTILRSREKKSPLLTLAALRRRLSQLRAVLKDHRGVIGGLIGPDFLPQVAETDRNFLIEVNRLFERLEDDVGRARETVIGSFELYSSRVAQDTNQLVKVLTIATVITGIIGAVAGIFGMNFDTPITHSGLAGFLIITGLMIASAVTIVVLAFWRRWI